MPTVRLSDLAEETTPVADNYLAILVAGVWKKLNFSRFLSQTAFTPSDDFSLQPVDSETNGYDVEISGGLGAEGYAGGVTSLTGGNSLGVGGAPASVTAEGAQGGDGGDVILVGGYAGDGDTSGVVTIVNYLDGTLDSVTSKLDAYKWAIGVPLLRLQESGANLVHLLASAGKLTVRNVNNSANGVLEAGEFHATGAAFAENNLTVDGDLIMNGANAKIVTDDFTKSVVLTATDIEIDSAGIFRAGDLAGTLNASYIKIDDPNKRIVLAADDNGTTTVIEMVGGASPSVRVLNNAVGADLTLPATGETELTGLPTATMRAGFRAVVKVDEDTKTVKLGDVNSAGNDVVVTIDDDNQVVEIAEADRISLLSGVITLGCQNSSTAGALGNGQISFYLDEVGNKLKVAVRYSNGTTKTGEIALT